MEDNNIKDLLTLLAGRVKLSAEDTEDFVGAMFGVIREALMRDRIVKIKGLGTFKVVDVDSRESVNVNTGERVTIVGHGKVGFTPDATMKELVNKPFSQFETVVLNDGVEFSDEETEAKEAEADTEETADSKPLATEPTAAPALAEAPLYDETPAPQESETPAAPTLEEELPQPTAVETFDVDAPELTEESETPIDEEPTPTEEVENSDGEEEEPEDEEPENKEPETDDTPSEEPAKCRTAKVIVLHFIGTLLLIGISGYAGYLLGVHQSTPSPTPPIEAAPPTPKPQPAPAPKAEADTVKPKDTVAVVRKDTAATPKQEKSETALPDYGKMDARVRTGAYRIVGLNRTIKAKAGETVKSISNRTLGPGMECYIEVFNNLSSSTKLQAGQEVKIPELKLKKRLKKQ